MCSLYPQQKCAYSALHPQAWTYIYTGPACRHLLSQWVQSPGFPKIIYYAIGHPKMSAERQFFLGVTVSSKFVTDNSDYRRHFFDNRFRRHK